MSKTMIERKQVYRWFVTWNGYRKSFGTEWSACKWLAGKLLCALVPPDRIGKDEWDDEGNLIASGFLAALHAVHPTPVRGSDPRWWYCQLRYALARCLKDGTPSIESLFIRVRPELREQLLSIVQERYDTWCLSQQRVAEVEK